MNWIILFGLWITGVFMLYFGFQLNQKAYENINWREDPGGWIFDIMPWWLVRSIFVLIGMGIIVLSFRFLSNIII